MFVINMIKNANDLFVIYKYDIGLCDTNFMDNKVYDSKDTAEKVIVDLQNQINDKISDLNKLGVTKITKDRFKVISLATFIDLLKETMYESGRTL
jgi:hypothetical protein